MLFALAAAPWLLATGVASAVLPQSAPRILDDREQYFQHAKNDGMCKTYSEIENEGRVLVVPGPSVLANFDVCVARNEFGEKLLQDKSGKIFCEGEVSMPLTE